MSLPRSLGSPRRLLPIFSALLGIAIAGAVVLLGFTTTGPDGRMYWQTSVVVPADANQTHPYVVGFRGATFSMWWPYVPPGSSSTGATGVAIRVTEPSGNIDSTSTSCAACLVGPQTWYSQDGSVGISYRDASPAITLLVAV